MRHIFTITIAVLLFLPLYGLAETKENHLNRGENYFNKG
jgi:hypothetical protein